MDGKPMSRTRYKIIPGDTSPYFLTATTVNWLPLFNNPTIAGIIFDSLRFLQAHNRLTIYAYVLMENHLHLVASAEVLEKEISNFKSFTARKSIDHYLSGENSFVPSMSRPGLTRQGLHLCQTAVPTAPIPYGQIPQVPEDRWSLKTG